MKRYVEITMNTLCVAALVFSAATYFSHLRDQHKGTVRTATAPPPGGKLVIPGVVWGGGKSIVFALSTSCHFCAASIPFYQDLSKQASQQGVRTIAAFPQPQKAIDSYLSDKRLTLAEAHQLDLDGIQVNSTPTLILVDKDGTVLQRWIGQLDLRGQQDVLDHVLNRTATAQTTPLAVESTPPSKTATTTSTVPPPTLVGESAHPFAQTNSAEAKAHTTTLTSRELRERLQNADQNTFLDIRDRDAFAFIRISKSINIPLSELEVRGSHEISIRKPVVLLCGYSAGCEASGIDNPCSQAATQLHKLGVDEVEIVRDRPRLLVEQRIPVEGTSPLVDRN